MKTMIQNLNDILAVLEKEETFVNAANVDKYQIISSKLSADNAKSIFKPS